MNKVPKRDPQWKWNLRTNKRHTWKCAQELEVLWKKTEIFQIKVLTLLEDINDSISPSSGRQSLLVCF